MPVDASTVRSPSFDVHVHDGFRWRTMASASNANAPPTHNRPELSASSLFDELRLEDLSLRDEAAPSSDVSSTAKSLTVSTGNLRYSPKKFRFIAKQIAGLTVEEAIKQMEFSPKKPARRVLNSLALARKNANLQKGLDSSNLVIAEAWVGKGQYGRGIRYHARGRFGVMRRPRSHMKIVLKEAEKVEDLGRGTRRNIGHAKGWTKFKHPWTPLKETKPIYNAKPYYNWW